MPEWTEIPMIVNNTSGLWSQIVDYRMVDGVHGEAIDKAHEDKCSYLVWGTWGSFSLPVFGRHENLKAWSPIESDRYLRTTAGCLRVLKTSV